MGSRGAYLKGGGFREYRYHTIMHYNNGSRKMTKQIDLDHKHGGIKPHIHIMNPATGLRDKSAEVRAPTKKESEKIYRIKRFYEKHGLKSKADRA